MSRIEARFDVRYPGFALDVTLDLPGRGVTALFGPSGCGKTTCLRAMAGLLHAPGGRLRVQGEVWQDDHRFVPTHRRPLGYVAQDAALFPHLTVRGNVEYGMTRVPAAQRKVSIDQAVALLGIDALMGRRPDALSGGERQRVAMARALATSPRLLLLDEPMAALDARRKAEVLPWLERLHRELDIPVIYVSHAIGGVARLADHLVLMEAGRVVQSGPASALLAQPDNALPLAEGSGIVVRATVCGHDAARGLTTVAFEQGQLQLPDTVARQPGEAVRVRLQAQPVLMLDSEEKGL